MHYELSDKFLKENENFKSKKKEKIIHFRQADSKFLYEKKSISFNSVPLDMFMYWTNKMHFVLTWV